MVDLSEFEASLKCTTDARAVMTITQRRLSRYPPPHTHTKCMFPQIIILYYCTIYFIIIDLCNYCMLFPEHHLLIQPWYVHNKHKLFQINVMEHK